MRILIARAQYSQALHRSIRVPETVGVLASVLEVAQKRAPTGVADPGDGTGSGEGCGLSPLSSVREGSAETIRGKVAASLWDSCLRGCGKTSNIRRKRRYQAQQGLKPHVIWRHFRQGRKTSPEAEQGLKPRQLGAPVGTTKVVPCYKTRTVFHEISRAKGPAQTRLKSCPFKSQK